MFATDHIYEALLYTDINLNSVEPDSILNEDHIKMIVQKSGMKYKSAKLKEEKERKNTDAVKRQVVNSSFWLFLFFFFLQVFGEEAALTGQHQVLWWAWPSEVYFFFFFAFTPLFLLQLQTSCRPSSPDPTAPSCHHPGTRGSRENDFAGQPAEKPGGIHGSRRHHPAHWGFHWYDPSPCASLSSISHSSLPWGKIVAT